MESTHYAGARELAAAVAERRIGALELTDAAIARIDALDPEINAVVVRDFERARAAAKALDAGNGSRGPLAGVPLTVKEAHNVAGLPTTWGMPPFRDWTAAQDSTAVRRLREAGAVILGKTNVPPFLADWQCSNPIYGRTSNPWDRSRTPGGSSGGGAAALAAGLVALELGSDLAGSIRVPAAFCGVLGHKPSFGLVPMRGTAPPGVDGVPPPLAVVGPMARRAGDLALALEVLAGPGDEEAKAYRLELPAPRHARLAEFRVLILDRLPGVALDDEIGAAIHDLGRGLAARGVAVDASSRLPFELVPMLECFGSMIGVVTSRGAPAEAAALSAHGWMDVADAQLAIRRQWAGLFRDFDVVLAPVFGTVAFPHDDRDMGERTLRINGEDSPYGVQGAWSSLASVANLPATAVPAGLSAAGLPMGVQIIGPYLEDRTTIAFAELLEREFFGFEPPPGL